MGGYLVDMSARYDAVWLSAVALSLGAGAMVFLMREQPKAQAIPA